MGDEMWNAFSAGGGAARYSCFVPPELVGVLVREDAVCVGSCQNTRNQQLIQEY